jgi:hypothetical protein
MPSVAASTIFLPGVQSNPQPSHYLNLIETCQKTGREVWNIWYLFAFLPEATQHLGRLTQEILCGPISVESSNVRALRSRNQSLPFLSSKGAQSRIQQTNLR